MDHFDAFNQLMDYCKSQDCNLNCRYAVLDQERKVSQCGFNLGFPPRYWSQLSSILATQVQIEGEIIEEEEDKFYE